MHGVNNVFMDKLFSLLHLELLPKGNKMLATTYEAMKLFKALGLNYEPFMHAQMVVYFSVVLRNNPMFVQNVMPIGMWMD